MPNKELSLCSGVLFDLIYSKRPVMVVSSELRGPLGITCTCASMTVTIISRQRQRLIATHPLHLAFLEWIPYFNLAWRKLWVDVCQTCYDIFSHPRLQSDFHKLKLLGLPATSTSTMTVKEIELYSSLLTASPLFASIAICHLRSEVSLNHDDGSEEALITGIWKEINAGQNQRTQIISFNSLFNPTSHTPWGPNAPLTEPWRMAAYHFGRKLAFMTESMQSDILFPAVQRNKNMSQETCNMLYTSGYRREDRGCLSYSTVDLERHYHQTGLKVEGCCECRWAWRFNDLKPRCYYCTGGRCYWVSRYMKPIAVNFMNALPITEQRRRSNPDSASYYVEDEDFVVIWDYASFTTSLVELRQFLFWAARYIEENSLGRDRPIKCFDYRLGIIDYQLWDLLDEYNTVVNIYTPYSIHRLLDDIGLDRMDDVMTNMVMQNSGPLGVHGNIGFSTTLGGLHTAAKVKNMNSGVGMGDDILGIVSTDPNLPGGLVDHANDLGQIPISKFGVFGPPTFGNEDGWKFVKRPIRRTQDGFSLGELVAFPMLAYVFNVDMGNRKFPLDRDYFKIVHRFVGQVGAFLWDLQKTAFFLTTEDYRLIRSLLEPAYRYLGLPLKGSLPGRPVEHNDERIIMASCIPSIQFEVYDPKITDWADHLWERSPVAHCRLPIKTSAPINILQYEPGKILATSTKFNRVWVDLGYLEEVDKLSEIVEVNDSNYWRFRATLHGDGFTLVNYIWLRQPPLMFHVSANDLQSSSNRVRDVGWLAHLFL